VQRDTQLAQPVLQQSAQIAQRAFGRRLIAAYALGSLAHGGFSAHVSDIDIGLVLQSPGDTQDVETIARIEASVRASGVPLAERLSVYWSTLDMLGGSATMYGRFPAVDILDLKCHGRLLVGTDVRNEVRLPELRELVVESARFALKRLATDAVEKQLRNPATLARTSPKILTKLVLYPIRFLFTASTGRIATNAAAVEHFSARHPDPVKCLAENALTWRDKPAANPEVVTALNGALLPLYRLFVSDYENRWLRPYHEIELADAYHKWRARLD
jgi:hypothetical protein